MIATGIVGLAEGSIDDTDILIDFFFVTKTVFLSARKVKSLTFTSNLKFEKTWLLIRDITIPITYNFRI